MSRRVVLVDTSGSMKGFKEEIEAYLQAFGEGDVIIGLNPSDEEPSIEILSDIGEDVEIDLEFYGDTPLSGAIETISELTDGMIIVVTDMRVNDEDNLGEVLDGIDNRIGWRKYGVDR